MSLSFLSREFLIIIIFTSLIFFETFRRKLVMRTKHDIPSIHDRLPFESISPKTIAKRRNSLEFRQFHGNLSAFVENYIRNYSSFHAITRKRCEKNVTYAKTVKLLVYRGYWKGGIGDHVRGLLHAFMASILSNRLFLIDVSIPLPLEYVWTNPPENNFTFDNSIFIVEDKHGNLRDGAIFDTNITTIRDFISDDRAIVQNQMKSFVFNSIMDRTPSIPHLQRKRVRAGVEHFRPNTSEIAPFLLQALFQTSLPLRKRLRRRWPFPGLPFVSIHARLGHGLGEIIDRSNATSLGFSLRDVAICVGRKGALHARDKGLNRIFISTDTRKMNNVIKQGVLEVLPYAHVQTAGGKAMHTSKLSKSGLSPKQEHEAFFRAFVDLGILSAGRSILYLRSGYVDAAQWLGAITDGKMLFMNECV